MRPEQDRDHDRGAYLRDRGRACAHVLDLSNPRVELRLNKVTQHLNGGIQGLYRQQQSPGQDEEGDLKPAESQQYPNDGERNDESDRKPQGRSSRRDPQQA
jgi:hypothetical protein